MLCPELKLHKGLLPQVATVPVIVAQQTIFVPAILKLRIWKHPNLRMVHILVIGELKAYLAIDRVGE